MKSSSLFQLTKMLTSHFISNFGSQVFSFGVGLFVLKETESALSFGMTILIGPLISLLLTPLVGHIADNFSRKIIVQVAQIFSVLSLILFFIFSKTFNSYMYITIIILLIVLHMCDKFLSVAFNASISSLVLDKDIQRTNSYLQMSSSLSMILAPVFGSMLFAYQEFSTFVLTIIFTEALSFFINIIINFNFNKNVNESNEHLKNEESIWLSFRSGLNYIKGNSIITFVIGIAVFVNLFITALFIGLPYVAIKIFQVNDIQYGLIESGIAIGIFIAGIIMGIKKDVEDPLGNLQLGIIGIGLLVSLISIPFIFPLSSTWITIYYFIINALIGGITTSVNVPIMVILHKTIKEEYKGRVFSIFFTSVQLFNPIGIFVFGILFEKINPNMVFICVGISMLLTVNLSTYQLLKKERRLILEKCVTSKDNTISS
ncbi:MFS transporter [Bacillus thuringiensis]|uniref:MFS transporter n=1 Tax=Bacillus thuringiensis TaxID=1428 RepID=UPI00366D2B54